MREDSIVAAVLDKLGVPTFSIIKIIEDDLQKKPSVSGPYTQVYPVRDYGEIREKFDVSNGVYFSGRMNRLFNNAQRETQNWTAL